ncbi:hypothetical protein [Burkholderia sp. AW49-1]
MIAPSSTDAIAAIERNVGTSAAGAAAGPGVAPPGANVVFIVE